jgi:hypothetical protein
MQDGELCQRPAVRFWKHKPNRLWIENLQGDPGLKFNMPQAGVAVVAGILVPVELDDLRIQTSPL